MSENVESNAVEPVSDSGSTQISAGTMLRNAREAEGVHISALAVSLKVPVKKLEALEADLFDLLPDAVFTRALAASVCRTLKIDPTSILERLPNTERPHLKTDESGINAPFRTTGNGTGMLILRQLSKPFVAAVLVLLLGVIAMFFLPSTPFTEIALSAKPDAPNSLFPSVTVEDAPKTGKPARTEEMSQTEQITSTSSSLVSTQQVTPAVSIAAPKDSGVNVPATVVQGPGVAAGLVVFTARGSSWIEVVDSQGAVQMRKTIQSGEVIAASGVLPLTVVVGRADTTDVQVRGKPFDLTRVSKDNVARFEVK